MWKTPHCAPVRGQPQTLHAVTWAPVPRAKNAHVSLQVNLENLIVSEQHSKPQVVQSWFWAQVFSLNSCHLGTLKLCRQEPWQRLCARACFLLYKFPCRSQYRHERIEGEFSRLKLGCTHSCPACANCQQLEHMHCSHLPRGIPLQLGKAVVWLQGHPVAFNAELDGPMHFAESFLFSKPSLVLFQATNTSLNSPGLETTSQLMDRRRKNSRQHSKCYFSHLHIFYHIYPFKWNCMSRWMKTKQHKGLHRSCSCLPKSQRFPKLEYY